MKTLALFLDFTDTLAAHVRTTYSRGKYTS